MRIGGHTVAIMINCRILVLTAASIALGVGVASPAWAGTATPSPSTVAPGGQYTLTVTCDDASNSVESLGDATIGLNSWPNANQGDLGAFTVPSTTADGTYTATDSCNTGASGSSAGTVVESLSFTLVVGTQIASASPNTTSSTSPTAPPSVSVSASPSDPARAYTPRGAIHAGDGAAIRSGLSVGHIGLAVVLVGLAGIALAVALRRRTNGR